jgi:hypothetical protein
MALPRGVGSFRHGEFPRPDQLRQTVGSVGMGIVFTVISGAS